MTDLSGPAYDTMLTAGRDLAAKMFAYAVRMYFAHHGASVASAQTMIEVIDLALAAETARHAAVRPCTHPDERENGVCLLCGDELYGDAPYGPEDLTPGDPFG